MPFVLREPPKEPQITDGCVEVAILRFNPSIEDEPHVVKYVVPYHRRMSVFTVLREIYSRDDPTLAFRNQQCGRGLCGICHVRIDLDRLGYKGKLVKGCKVLLEPGDRVFIQPYNLKKVVRDIVVA